MSAGRRRVLAGDRASRTRRRSGAGARLADARPLRSHALLLRARIDLGDVPPVLVPAIAFIAIACVAKTATGWIVSAGLDVEARLRADRLIAHGEFSIVIAGLAASSTLGLDLTALASTLVLGTARSGLSLPISPTTSLGCSPRRSDNGRPARLSISHFAVSGPVGASSCGTDDRVPGRRLRRRRATRLHARVRRLAQNTDDASHALSHRPFRPKRAPLSPKPVPKIHWPSWHDRECGLFQPLSALQATATTSSPPSQGGAQLNRARLRFAGSSLELWPTDRRAPP